MSYLFLPKFLPTIHVVFGYSYFYALDVGDSNPNLAMLLLHKVSFHPSCLESTELMLFMLIPWPRLLPNFNIFLTFISTLIAPFNLLLSPLLCGMWCCWKAKLNLAEAPMQRQYQSVIPCLENLFFKLAHSSLRRKVRSPLAFGFANAAMVIPNGSWVARCYGICTFIQVVFTLLRERQQLHQTLVALDSCPNENHAL